MLQVGRLAVHHHAGARAGVDVGLSMPQFDPGICNRIQVDCDRGRWAAGDDEENKRPKEYYPAPLRWISQQINACLKPIFCCCQLLHNPDK